ncbi:MAG TPA: hypothetical protein PLZ51_25025, partial [Aggregatilineales bacterium]|nr:hypothetical protein [Aggregatilineales bacterium]
WETVSPILGFLINWFVTTGIPIIVGIINDVVVPAFGVFVNIISSIWNAVAPALQTLIDWFQSTGWPLIEGIINTVITPAINFLV